MGQGRFVKKGLTWKSKQSIINFSSHKGKALKILECYSSLDVLIRHILGDKIVYHYVPVTICREVQTGRSWAGWYPLFGASAHPVQSACGATIGSAHGSLWRKKDSLFRNLLSG